MDFLSQLFELILTPAFASSILRITTPILFAALGGIMARRCGIMNLALEGTMLTAALFAVVGSALIALSLMLCFVRVVGGVHYPSDVAAGFLSAVVWGSLLYMVVL